MVMRGYCIALAHWDQATWTWAIQLLEYLSGKQKHVCRGVWSAELLNLCDLWDMGLIMLGFLEEVHSGVMSASKLRELTTYGPLSTPTELCTDSFSIYSYLRTQHLKFPTDKGTFYHLAHLHQACERQLLQKLTWVDTRDMVMDGMTKGKLDRKTLKELMNGTWKIEHKQEHFLPAKPNTPTTTTTATTSSSSSSNATTTRTWQ